MKKNQRLFTVLLVVAVICLVGAFTGTLRAGDDPKEEKPFTGSFMVGYRLVDTDGTETKYKEDINLEKGPRLFQFNIHFVPQGEMKKLFDTLDVRLYNFGGDPYESFGIEARKYGKYQFQYDRRKSTYFYSDILAAHDYHTFDFQRINDTGLLKIWLGKQANIYMDYNRYTKKGNSVTTFDINRVEFEFEKPIDETSTDISLGASYNGNWFSLVLEEKIQEYKNVNSMFLPGYADGGEPTAYPSALAYFHLDQPYSMEGNIHSLKFSLRPIRDLLIKGGLQIMKQDTDFTYYEDANGVDYLGYDFRYDAGGDGEFNREIQAYDVDLSYMITAKLALVGAARYQRFEQTGTFTADGETTDMALKYEIGGYDAGLQYQPTGKFGITVGIRYERRDVQDEVEIEDEDGPTDRTGFFGTVNWKPTKAIGLTADYQYGTYKNPLTLISPTDYYRYRLTAKYRLKNFNASASYLHNKSKSDQKGETWNSDRDQFNLRMGINARKVNVYVGYSLIDVQREGNRTVFYPPAWSGGEGSFVWDILYEGKSHLYDAGLYLDLAKAWGAGGYLNYYKNTGSWELSRTTLKAFVKYEWQCGLITQLGYRFVDYKEKKLGYNDYEADILEISLGYRW